MQPLPADTGQRDRASRASLLTVLGMLAVLLVAVIVTASVVLTGGDRPERTATTPPTTPRQDPPAAPSTADCQYVPAPTGAQEQRRAPTPDARPALATRTRTQIRTNMGVVEVELSAEDAPCTVNSFLSLARANFFAGTPCHRLTTDGFYVLQCGDPGGTGDGGPGYRFGDENLPVSSRPAYPRGTLAMANAGPGTNGSQFFLVYRDSEIDPNYSVFGTVTAGMEILDRIASAGTDDSNGPGDGHPKQEVMIDAVIAP